MKLEQIPKKKPLHAPEGYFDTLPGIVQSRIETERPVRQSPVYLRVALRYALLVLALLVAGIFWFRSFHPGQTEFEAELATIDAQNLEVYLQSTDITTTEFLETADWSSEELEALENSVYASYDLPVTEVNELLDVYEVEPIKDSVQ